MDNNKKFTPVDTNKMFFYVFLRVATSYFKSFYKKEQEEFLAAEDKRINETENKKLKQELIRNKEKGRVMMTSGHNRFLDISDNILRHAVNKADINGQDYYERVTVGIKMLVERVNNVQDFPRIAQMIDIYNTGALNDIFEKKVEEAEKTAVVSEDDKALFEQEKTNFEKAIEKTAEDSDYKKFVEKPLNQEQKVDYFSGKIIDDGNEF